MVESVGKYQSYAEYKDSGVEWLGEIPSNWKIVPTKQLFNIVNGATPKSGVTEFWDGRIIWVTPSDLSKLSNFEINDSGRYITKKGFESCGTSLVPAGSMILSCRAPIGSLAITTKEICTNQGCKSLVVKNKTNSKFAFYYFSVSTIQLNILGKGTTFLELSTDELGNFAIPSPSLDEQTQIANFLDHETAKIDSLIEKQQQLIQLLKEKRQAVISHAVTKGLDPSVKLKDSGVQWLGEVPEHWTVVQLKHACDLLKDGTHLPPPRVDVGIPLLSVRNVVNGKFIFRDDDSQISKGNYKLLCKSFIPQKGDVLLAIVGATLGKVAVVENMKNFHIQRSLAIFRTNEFKINNYFLNFLFSSQGFQNLLWENAGFSAQPGIYLGSLSNFLIPMPSLLEQIKITNFLNDKTQAFDNLIKKAQTAIQLIQERRTALISAAVTGKIDVRNWQNPIDAKTELSA